MRLAILLAMLLCAAAVEAVEAGDRLRIATWHIDDLWHVPGEALRVAGSAATVIRDADDLAALQRLGDDLDADVVALQSIGSPAAARRIFPAGRYHIVFSRELARRFAEDNRVLDDPARRGSYLAIAVRRQEGLRVNRVLDVPAVRGGRAPALAVELRVEGEPLWLLAVDLEGDCPTAGEDALCPAADAAIEALGGWVDAQIAKGALIVIAGNLGREALWRRLDGASADAEKLVELAGAEGPAYQAPQDKGAATGSSWKLLTPRRTRDGAGVTPPQPALATPSTEAVGVGKLASRAEKRRGEPAPTTSWEVVVAAFRELFATTRAEREKTRAEEAAAAERAKSIAYAAAREAARRNVEIAPAPTSEGGRLQAAVGARLARFPGGHRANPCTAAGFPPPLDSILLDRRLTEEGGLVGFGVLPLPSGSGRGSLHCPVFTDLRF